MALKILIVEDDVNLNIMLPLILKKKKVNWEFRSAHDGIEALEVLKTYMPDLVLADLEMPRMGGLELIQRIKADPRLTHLKVAVLSATDDAALKDEVRAAGVQDLWMKPIFPEILFSRITTLLG